MTNTLLLKAKMIENKQTQESIATKLGIRTASVNAKINNKKTSSGKAAQFTQVEINGLIDCLNLSSADVMSIFFTK